MRTNRSLDNPSFPTQWALSRVYTPRPTLTRERAGLAAAPSVAHATTKQASEKRSTVTATIHATDEHPLHVTTKTGGGRWVNAEDLEPGQQLTSDDPAHTITVTRVDTYQSDLTVYNLTTIPHHTYYIHPTRAPPTTNTLVHNCGPSDIDDAAAKAVPNPKPVLKGGGVPDRSSPWYVSYRDADGNLQTVGNLDGVHAEVRIQQMQPGAQMSKPFGWRTLDSAKGPEWVEGTVCGSCQVFPRDLFAPGTRGAGGGPWGD